MTKFSGPFNESTIIGTSRNRSFQFPNKVYLRSHFDKDGRKTKELHDLTYKELEQEIRALGVGLYLLGGRQSDRVGVFGHNTPRWIAAVLATLAGRGTFVPIYPSSKTEDVWWILSDSEAKAVFCEGKEQIEKVLEVKDKLPNLKWIIVLDPDEKIKDEKIISYAKVMEKGRADKKLGEELEVKTKEASPDDLAAIIYTSGTTGRPKGVMLTNNNFNSQRVISDSFDFNTDDIWFGHLPMCHVFGLSSDLLNSGQQAGTLFVLESVETEYLRANLRLCRPTVMSSVPRLWEKVYIQINSIVSTKKPFEQKVFHWAVGVGKECFLLKMDKKPVPLGLKLKSKVAGAVFKKVRGEAGLDRLRICHTGGGPVSPDLIVFFGAIGVNLYQGFGLTETSPVTHTCTPANHKLGYVGQPIPGTECKIADDGEILIKGPQVMKGYFHNEEATKAAFTPDGFFMTGDIGEITPDGHLRITDRKKELIITSGGKNIPPQPIEIAFNTDPFVEQIFLSGDNRNYLVALLVPDFVRLKEWAKEKGVEYTSQEDLVKKKPVLDLYRKSVDQVNQNLAKYETIKRFAVLPNAFTEAGGELTPTLKLKRRVIEKKYKNVIESLYAGGE
ncbi:MAG: long-chain fatty acid--CoA ligase [bacterium]|nr:long-chain fatty acid--CoA ligase [bacterium]